MKKTLLSAVIACFSMAAAAQYYYLPNIVAGENPGGLMTDNETVGDGTWTQILTSGATQWSAAQSVPFTFNFNGSPVPQYKVSPTGVLTFTIGAVQVPSSTNGSLSDFSIPDKSIAAWGFDLSGTNDACETKTVGTAPNRQHWVRWTSATDPTISGQQYTYWAVVLEETTDRIYVVDMRTFFAQTSVDITLTVGLKVDIATQVTVAGSPNVGSNGSNSGSPNDNSYYEFFQGQQPAAEAELITVTPQVGTLGGYAQAGGSATLGTIFRNRGANTVTDITLKYSDGTNTFSDVKSGLSVAPGFRDTVDHATSFSPPIGVTDITFWLELAGDTLRSNDTGMTQISGWSSMPTHASVIEEATSTDAGWAPLGFVHKDTLLQQHANACFISVHSDDPMDFGTYDDDLSALPEFDGYPSFTIDRKAFLDPRDAAAAYTGLNNRYGFASITAVAAYDDGTRASDITVFVRPTADQLPGDYRLALVFVEDSVTGTGNGDSSGPPDYDQENNYSNERFDIPLVGAGLDWQAEPDPVLATKMVYNDVARAILGGFNGVSGSLPASMTNGGEYTYTFNYNIPTNFNTDNLTPIVLLINATTSEILNSLRLPGLNVTVGVDPVELEVGLSLFPNPVSGQLLISVDAADDQHGVIAVTDLMGRSVQIVFAGSLAGSQQFVADVSALEAGMYMVSVSTSSGLMIRPFIKE